MPRTVRRGTRSRDEIDEKDEDQPRRRRGSHREEEQPRRGRSRSRDEDDAPGFDDADEEDEKPRRRASRVKDEPRKSNRSGNTGWGAAEEVRESLPASGNFAEDLKLPEKGSIVIKFAEPEPFDSYKEHWVPQKGKQSFTCADDDCPLCDVGHRPSAKICFNVISLADPDKPELKRWRTGVQIAESIKEFSEDKKTSPLDRDDYYYEVKRSKTKNDKTVTTITPIKARDLDEDFDIEPLTEDEIDEAIEKAGGLYDYTSTDDTPIKVLEEQADKVAA